MASEEESAAVVESSPEPVLPPENAPKKPKRLTLQERLAAAAKAKRKKAENTKKSVLPVAENADSRTESEVEDSAASPGPVEITKHEKSEKKGDVLTSPEKEKDSDAAAVENAEAQQGDVEGKSTATPEESSLVSDISSERGAENGEAKEIPLSPEDPKDAQISQLQAEIRSLNLKLEESRKKETIPTRRAPADSDKKVAEKERLLSQCEKKLAEKDTTIQQLMDEGQELSKKELKLNERIRTLVANNTKLESSLRSYSEKNEESLLKLGEIEDLMKGHKLKSVDQLFDVMAASNQKIQDLQTALDREKDSNWEGKYRELQRVYEKELDEKRECKKELSERQVQLELLQNQSRLELQSKSDIIAQLNREIMASKDESSTEVLRLEAKIESLRMENESFLKTAQNPGNTENGDTAKKSVDYVDFVKLSETHQNLQAQYVSSQENWKLIESSLLTKVETLTASVENLKKTKAKHAAEVKKLHTRLNSQLDEIEALKGALEKAEEEKNEQNFRLQMKKNEYTELEERLEELKTVFGSDRKNYDVKIKNLTETIQSLESNQTPTFTPTMSYDNLAGLQSRRGIRDGGLHISMERQPVQRKFSTNSISSSAINTPAQVWEEASFSEGPESSMYENHDISAYSLNEEIYPFDAPEPDSMMNNSMNSASAGTTKNIQIINKMSASMRRLEIEISTLKEENEQLAAQNESAQREIMSRLELDAKLGELEDRIAELSRELEEKSRKEGTLLEVIGEKSEKVGELEADVEDLKDLLRQQVQQMIEMQNK